MIHYTRFTSKMATTPSFRTTWASTLFTHLVFHNNNTCSASTTTLFCEWCNRFSTNKLYDIYMKIVAFSLNKFLIRDLFNRHERTCAGSNVHILHKGELSESDCRRLLAVTPVSQVNFEYEDDCNSHVKRLYERYFPSLPFSSISQTLELPNRVGQYSPIIEQSALLRKLSYLYNSVRLVRNSPTCEWRLACFAEDPSQPLLPSPPATSTGCSARASLPLEVIDNRQAITFLVLIFYHNGLLTLNESLYVNLLADTIETDLTILLSQCINSIKCEGDDLYALFDSLTYSCFETIQSATA